MNFNHDYKSWFFYVLNVNSIIKTDSHKIYRLKLGQNRE